MQGPIYAELAPVRRRQQSLFVLRTASYGLLAGAVAGIALGLGRWLAGWQVSPTIAAAVLLAGPILGILVGLLWRRSWRGAAMAVDRRYQLKDRAATALAFLTRRERTELHELQVRDAVEHLTKIQPRQVEPLHLPRVLGFAAALLLVAVALLVWPVGSQQVEAGLPDPLAAVVAEAERLEEDLKEFEDLARREHNPDLEKLVQELREKVEEMKQPGVDEREALAKLSEMQAAVAAQQAQYNVGLVDGQLQALGDAMSAARSLDGAGNALQEAKYEKAAKELEKLEEMEDLQLERKEAKAVEEKLKHVAKGMDDVGLGQLSEAASEMAEGVKGSKGKLKKATREIAKEVRRHDRRKKINEVLDAQVARLKDAKSNVERNGGARVKFTYKSLSPSSSWGREISGNVLGEKTKMLAQHQLEELTGTPGEGPSDVETTHSAEGRQQAARGYREVYKKYRRMSEAVLDSEPIPLGHRQMIRRYFELIRPQSADGDKKEGTEKAP
jgi:hypothetical protein